jgi:hypothetical protein
MMAWLRPVLPGGLAVLLLHLAACGPGEGVRIDGRFAEGAEDVADRVWVTGTPGSAAVEDGRFRIRAVPLGGGLDLRFERDGEQVGRLDLRGVDGARRLRLAGLWIHEESLRAFPVTVEGAPGLVVSNGWRTGEVWEEGDAVDVAGLVLGRRTRDNTLAVRPDDGDLPDLLAVVDDETRIETSGGDGITLLDVVESDSVRVAGRWMDGALRAERIERARPAAIWDWGRGAVSPPPAASPTTSPTSPNRPSASPGRGSGPPPHAGGARGRERGRGPPR